MSCSKGFFVFINVVFLIGAVGVIGVGIYDLVGAAQIMGPRFLGIGCIAAGFVAAVFAFIGFCGAMKQSPCALGCYFALVLLLALFELGVGIAAFVVRNTSILDIAQVGWQALYNGNAFEKQQILDIENMGRCCGFNSTTDMVVTPCTFTIPCGPVVHDWLQTRLILIGAIILGVAGFQIIGMITACFVRRSIKKAETDGRYEAVYNAEASLPVGYQGAGYSTYGAPPPTSMYQTPAAHYARKS